MPRFASLAVVFVLAAVSVTDIQAAVLLSFGGYTWDQANVPNKGIQLGVDDATTRSGATFGPLANPPANMTRTNNITGFIEGQAGANTAVGYLARITKRRNGDPNPNSPLEDGLPTAIDSSNKTTPAVNIPQSANINAAIIRRGIQVGWAAGTNSLAQPVLRNGPGTDFVIWESGDSNQPDAMMVRVRDAASQNYTDWFYYTPVQQAVTGGVLFGFAYDLTNFGLPSGRQIDLIEMANMVSTDRINGPGANTANGWVAQGHVRPEAGGNFGPTNPGPDPGNITPPYGVPFGNSTYDPDPLYVSVLGNLTNFAVPEAGSLLIWSVILAAGMSARKMRLRIET
jgi:hypothetical protein